ncbi:hypothetical protein AVEN_85657-1, partial [Araneus ventricosus]
TWDGRDWITRPTAPIMPKQTFAFFPVLKSTLSGRPFRSNEEVHRAVKNFLPSLGTDFCHDGLLKLI